MNLIQQILRAALFLDLAFFGLVMAFVFMASTALAIGVLYIVARLKGRPFAPSDHAAWRLVPDWPTGTGKGRNGYRDAGDSVIRGCLSRHCL